MADTPPPPSSEPNTPPSSAAEQARIRKERREAKIRAGGSARLNKITGLGGGIQRDAPAQPTASESQSSNNAGDPEEVDISQHYYQPASTARSRIPPQQPDPPQLSDEQLRAMMLGFPPSGTGTPQHKQPPLGSNPFVGFPGMEGLNGPDADDPMIKLLQQMMGGMGGAGAGAGGPGGMFPHSGIPGQELGGGSSDGGDPYAYLWRIIHAVFALGLGIYIALTANFTGTKRERDLSALNRATGSGGVAGLDESSVRFFYIFATVEVILQTCRFFVEKGSVQPAGILGIVMGFLPQPWKGYLELMMRYGRIWTTTTGDALVCVFVLGVCSWLRAA